MSADIKTFIKSFLSIGIAICLLAIIQTELQTEALFKIRTRYKWLFFMSLLILQIAVSLYLIMRENAWGSFWGKLEDVQWRNIAGKICGVILFVLPFPILWYALTVFFGKGGEAFFRLLWLFWWLVLAQATAIKINTRISLPICLAACLLFDGILSQTYALSLAITDYPFSLGWSEASRFYYGSLLFSKSIYGVRLPLSIWHGTRYLLQSIPFIIKGLPLWADRLWQVILWIGITALTSWTFVRRLKIQDRTTSLILASWFFLYLFQGAVYYHLQVCVIIILLGVSMHHRWRTLIVIAAASFWAGMSRLNWYPVPAILAITLYIMEVPFSKVGRFWQYIAQPALWGALGLLSALLGQAFYVVVSRNTNLQAFGSSLTSALLWYRWFPSDTNPIGIIPGILIVSLPLFILLFFSMRGHTANLHPLRRLGLLVMLLLLFIGGLVVSTKIGGGGDLHNMDAYMVMLALLAAYFIGDRIEIESGVNSRFEPVQWPTIALMLLIPVAFSLSRISPPFTYNKATATQDLSTLRAAVETYTKSGPVLFIYERQLLTFGMIPNVPIIPDYEVVSLMEMAISGNRTYLNEYYNDLATHRFTAIVAHKQNLGVNTGDFIEESDTWNYLVGQPLLCQYKPVLTVPSSNIQIFVPRAKSCTDFPPALGKP